MKYSAPDLFDAPAPEHATQAADPASHQPPPAAPLFAQGGLWSDTAPLARSPAADAAGPVLQAPLHAACHGVVDTRFGPAMVWLDLQGRLLRLDFHLEQELQRAQLSGSRRDDAAVAEVARQLHEYERGERRSFDLPLAARGTAFQQQVWAALCCIPYGETMSYGELALALGKPGGARAVGRANATNPIALIVPCHRVLGADGSLTGYAGGLPLKSALLRFEQENTVPGLFGAAGRV
ncbi:methylated-DNA--[protein]-cysteine S-methyltransferase [Aquitalea magnusonii]|uniref:Methylated-DNA--protein-cysteine methyltransferase n=2 Tax=Aquitalea magnusonii TaxID=332411 RepID=A0A318JVA5_9NEIS|nr:methylated-DNA--[protein]-cysteine S-methyltransferase [Aquitalea magnusonii]PXX48764.1 methylated-DNA-[protein]-cysteine S-methyltransferase [Aquitalea magnusonii]